MRILFVHPNYHSGGAEIAGNWPPAWVAYLTGYLKAGGYHDVIFVDAVNSEETIGRVVAASGSLADTKAAETRRCWLMQKLPGGGEGPRPPPGGRGHTPGSQDPTPPLHPSRPPWRHGQAFKPPRRPRP